MLRLSVPFFSVHKLVSHANIIRTITRNPPTIKPPTHTPHEPHFNKKQTYDTKTRNEQSLHDIGVPVDAPQKLKRRIISQMRRQRWTETSSAQQETPNSFRKKTNQTKVDQNVLNYVQKLHAGKRTKNIKLTRELIEKKKGPPHLSYIFRKEKLKNIAQASEKQHFPKANGEYKLLPEVAFAGRSNVGKSTLLNTLVGSKGKAAVSDKPGMTQTLNWYQLGEYVCMVDLPGYGFAYADETKIENWNELIRWYLTNRTKSVLKRVFVLLDSRHGMKEPDREFLNFLNENKIKNQIILTKSDLVFPDILAKRIQIINQEIEKFKSTVPDVLLVSGKEKSGIVEIQKVMCTLMDQARLRDLQSKIQKREEKKSVVKANQLLL